MLFTNPPAPHCLGPMGKCLVVPKYWKLTTSGGINPGEDQFATLEAYLEGRFIRADSPASEDRSVDYRLFRAPARAGDPALNIEYLGHELEEGDGGTDGSGVREWNLEAETASNFWQIVMDPNYSIFGTGDITEVVWVIEQSSAPIRFFHCLGSNRFTFSHSTTTGNLIDDTNWPEEITLEPFYP